MDQSKNNKNNVCTCGKSNATYDSTNVKVILILLAAIPVASGIITRSIGLAVLVVLVQIVIYLVCVVINKLKGHTLSCSMRKSILDIDELLSVTSSIG